jgi:hypothetical protein
MVNDPPAAQLNALSIQEGDQQRPEPFQVQAPNMELQIEKSGSLPSIPPTSPTSSYQQNYSDFGMNLEETIILNVGGTRFRTFKSTLMKHRNAFFGLFFSQNHYDWLTPEGDYFFDRNPALFGLILEYYRTGILFVPKDVHFGSLWKEVMYFGLDRVITRAHIDMEQQVETRYPNSWATHLACRFLPILQRAIEIKLLQFSVVIDFKGNYKGVPSLLQHPSDFKFWNQFCSSFAQAPPGSKDDFGHQFLSSFNVMLNPLFPRSTSLPGNPICVQVDSKMRESTNISYVLFRVKNIRVPSKQLKFVDRRGDSKESKVELLFLDGWQLDFCLPSTLTASQINDESELFLIN